ncbi:hypothetical protein HFV01_22960 [Limnospira fusiformis SAG 85.79]|uniref:Uncharacterized protein n=2 Tax=Limnospira TaxID=2596745 RepID=A0A9P1KCE8_9CYAN|nr:hypothetical protein AmaxDRAFT_2178 [Limnospira maxima CS-328]EKD10744.1 hypothetical protein SPLC1_S061180 [Arthrospira platensis C1]QJB28120.1 hypothetical protein HFV01_22960 [Limnospira fusiformis SAG 85.79]UWU50614.1 hypothetical protein APLC1_5541 [Arthrospira platensis C1]CDM93284.1 hypothetical protein ARTHRO_10957 [Limnospira indica PCC 8005]
MGGGEGDFTLDPYLLEGEGCDQKPMPNCNGWDMPTGHGVDIDTAMSRSTLAQKQGSTTCCIRLRTWKYESRG